MDIQVFLSAKVYHEGLRMFTKSACIYRRFWKFWLIGSGNLLLHLFSEIIDSIVERPFCFAGGAGDMVCLLLQSCTVTVWAFEEVDHVEGNIHIGIAGKDGFYEDTGCKLKERACRLKEAVQRGEQAGGDYALQQTKAEM